MGLCRLKVRGTGFYAMIYLKKDTLMLGFLLQQDVS